MDEMSELMAGMSGVSSEAAKEKEEKEEGAHPRLAQFKGRGAQAERQEQRRADFRAAQKERRFDAQMRARQVALDLPPSPDPDDPTDARPEKMDLGKPFHKRGTRNTGRGRDYGRELMLGEWLMSVPEELGEAYVAVAVPEGRRCLVVASKGLTTAYTRSGRLLKQFQSSLPGGAKNSRNDYTLLDGLFLEAEATVVVLDLLCWKSQPMYDSETEFRFFWLGCQLAERPELGERSRERPYAFRAAPTFAADQEGLRTGLEGWADWPFEAPLDGLLFYPKDAPYTPGSNPLVGWLKPWMVPQVLGAAVPQRFLQGAPDSAAEFIADFHSTHKGWKTPTLPTPPEKS